jgi:DNA-binding CsgD family transcriptional regulator
MKNRDIKKIIRWLIGFTLVTNLAFLVKDLSDDLAEGAGFWHIGPEVLIVIGTVVIAVLALLQYTRVTEKAERFALKVRELEAENRDWQERTKMYSEGLAKEIDLQLTRWELSQAEKQIALLLLKGLSNKEIAEIRETTEHTIKQQSSAVYRKSGLSSRSELSAFFLEDLLTPN